MKCFKPYVAGAALALTASSLAIAQTVAPPTTEKAKMPAATEPGPASTALTQPSANTPQPSTGTPAAAPAGESAPSLTPATGDAPSDAIKEEAAKTDATLTQSPGDTAISKLIGASVYNTGNEHIGEIEDLIISSNGAVTTVVIGVGGFLGIGEKKVAMPFASLRQEKGDNNLLKVVVPETRESLKAHPDFKYAANS